MNTRFEEKLTEIPEIPKTFGEDGGHFYRYYDAIADEIDDDMVKSLKAQLDGILIYAGLFAGVNSAFLALTLPEMSADPADDTNALLLQLVTGGNGNITSAGDLPSASFSPPSGTFPVSILFSLSLTLALLAAFLAVLGQQWLVYYRKRSGGGAEAQRWEQLRRYLGAKRWRLEVMLDDILPSLLQLGLVIFCIGFALYLSTLSRWLCYTVAIPMGLALASILFMAVSAAVDQWCPFKSPLSRALQSVPSSISQPVWLTLLYCLSWTSIKIVEAGPVIDNVIGPMTTWVGQGASYLRARSLGILSSSKKLVGKMTRSVVRRVLGKTLELSGGSSWPMEATVLSRDNWVSRVAQSIPRPAESVDRLHAIAARRVLCTSEDANALIYTAANLHALDSPEDIQWLMCDAEFYGCLKGEWETPSGSFRFDPRASDPVALKVGAFYSAFTCLVFSSGSVGLLLAPNLLPPPLPLTDDSESFKDLRDVVSAMNVMGLSWFEDNAALYDASAEDAHPFAPITVCLLGYAIQCFGKIQPKLSGSSDDDSESDSALRDEDRLWLLSTDQEYMEWGLRTVCNIIRLYSCWRQHGDGLLSLFLSDNNEWGVLGLLKAAFATFDLDPSIRPPDRIYVSLLQQGCSSFVVANRYSDTDTKARHFFATSAMDISSHFIRLSWEAKLSERETSQLRNDLAKCIGIIDKTLPSTRRPYRKPSFFQTKQIMEFLELVSDSLKRRSDLFDETVISKILDLEERLMSLAPPWSNQDQLDLYKNVYQGIKYSIKDLRSSGLAFGDVGGDPADVPAARIVG
ncbi:hypothetical protein FS837_005596 [Tulasnella sp. UAMH 9824]|nr:hypothetical protein FS837_005596 [Tulasnella sp. UAMH 9824]